MASPHEKPNEVNNNRTTSTANGMRQLFVEKCVHADLYNNYRQPVRLGGELLGWGWSWTGVAGPIRRLSSPAPAPAPAAEPNRALPF